MSGSVLLDKILALSRSIGAMEAWVGHSAFLLFALAYKCRPFVWEGSSRVDLLDIYAPWAVELCPTRCTIDAVACCMVASSRSLPDMHAVSAAHPLRSVKHWLGGISIATCEADDGTPVGTFYRHHGVVVLGSVTDGNCGIDVMCQMLGLTQSIEQFYDVRTALAAYLVARAEVPWMHDLLVACQEVTEEDVQSWRKVQPTPVIDLADAGVAAAAVAHDFAVADVAVAHVFAGADVAVAHDFAVADAVATNTPQPTDASTGEISRDSIPAIADADAAVADADLAHKALAWATSSNDTALLLDLCANLPSVVVDEQIRAFVNRPPPDDKPKAAVAAPVKYIVNPLLLHSRMKAAALYDDFRKGAGVDESSDAPRGMLSAFVTEHLVWKTHLADGAKTKNKHARQRSLSRWHALWNNHAQLRLKEHNPRSNKRSSEYNKARNGPSWGSRQRRHGTQGQPHKVEIVRQQLYAWFISMRFSIDWKKYNAACRKASAFKCIGRFPRSLLKAKLRQFLSEYCQAMLVKGLHPTIPLIRHQWFSSWEAEYGLSMKQPTRKYKVPFHILEERCEIGWLNTFRVRAACLALNGYDPDMENFDQSPYYVNESGAKNISTLAVAGLSVPLVEGHADTRERWTGNFTTFSDKSRILAGEIPYVEVMLRSDADTNSGTKRKTIELRVREHIRSRGYGPWLTVATSPKGSYREADVLTFLERHLTPLEGKRCWRIMFADDFSAHLTDAVWRLCWHRGYVLIPLGGGVTGVQQTVDLDLNQHVRREYTAAETVELIAMMRSGITVPSMKAEDCVDILHGVMANKALHLAAADSYEKAGFTANLSDDDRDQFIVREAGGIWARRHMRQKVNAAVAAVRDEVDKKRLTWTHHDVQRLIRPYPPKSCDDALRRLGAEASVDAAVVADDGVVEAEGSAEGAGVEGEGDAGVEGQEAASEDGDDAMEEGILRSLHEEQDDVFVVDMSDMGDVPFEDTDNDSAADKPPVVHEAHVELVERSEGLIAILEETRQQLLDHGLMSSAGVLENDIRGEKRRVRDLSREDPGVLMAVARARDAEEARDRKRRIEIADANSRIMTRHKLQKRSTMPRQS
jgi:hypothetical protein